MKKEGFVGRYWPARVRL